MSTAHTLEPLGDQALIARFESESAALGFAQTLRRQSWDWLFDVVPAYRSVGIFFDADQIRLAEVKTHLNGLLIAPEIASIRSRLHRLPCCYERGPDLDRVARITGHDRDTVIAMHTAEVYIVYAIGFCPGFPYLGYLPPELTGVPRLESPRLRVEPGSVGLTGRQTGLYPMARPGGWNLIGQTPVTIVDVADGFFPIRVGDRVQFERIDEGGYTRREGERLS